jgi:hypothetical protein
MFVLCCVVERPSTWGEWIASSRSNSSTCCWKFFVCTVYACTHVCKGGHWPAVTWLCCCCCWSVLQGQVVISQQGGG